MEQLLPFQYPHFYQLEETMKVQRCCLDASDTGTGKTYVAIALAKKLSLNPFIICPKSVIPNWVSVTKLFGVQLFGIANYEMLKGCKYYNQNLEKMDCQYMEKVGVTKQTFEGKKSNDELKKSNDELKKSNDELKKSNDQSKKSNNDPHVSIEEFINSWGDERVRIDSSNTHRYKEAHEMASPMPTDKKGTSNEDFVFNLPHDCLVIFDEAHRCKNYRSITSRLLLSICKDRCKILLLSATISDKIECFKPFGVVFGFYDNVNKFKMWIRKNKEARKIYYQNKKKKDNIDMSDDEVTLDLIHTKIFPQFGSRMRIKDLGDMFPSNQVLSQSYMSANQEEIQKQYQIVQEAFKDLKDKEKRSAALGKLIRARMKIEMFKVPIMLDVVEEAMDSGYSIAIFVNYRDTMSYLAHYFNTDCLIYGDQSMEDRQDSIDKFQSNRSRIIIAIIQAGGVGISLHDIHGGHPRMSVISPTWSGQDMQQVLGRIHRAGSKSPALQRIVYCSGTYEERICELIQKKLTNITAINDMDLIGPQFTQEKFEEIEQLIEKTGDEKNLQSIDKTIDQTIGQTTGQTIGQTTGQTIGQTTGQTIGQTTGQTIDPTMPNDAIKKNGTKPISSKPKDFDDKIVNKKRFVKVTRNSLK